jgi:hypothetical protein
MYFILFDPIFWINKTLATFDSLIAKLQKQIEKCNKEMEANLGGMRFAETTASRKAEKAYVEAERKADKAKAKRDAVIDGLQERNTALSSAKKRAATTAKNLSELMGGEDA